MKKLKLGQTLYSLNVGNAARHRTQELTPVIVTHIGRKYFTCKKAGSSYAKFYFLDDWSEKSEFLATSKLYETPEEWEGDKLKTEIIGKIRKAFEYGGSRFALEQLKKVDSILFGGEI